MKWCNINKWLTTGKFTFMFDNWTKWFGIKKLSIREFNLFQIMWDNGAWWGLELDYQDTATGGKVGEGKLNCFFQIVFFGLGIRYSYKKKAKVVLPSPKELATLISSKTEGVTK